MIGQHLAKKFGLSHNTSNFPPSFLRRIILMEARLVAGQESDMLLSNLEYVPGCDVVQYLGLVQGSSVRAKHLGRDIMAGLKNLTGGELKGYTELLQETRQEAIVRMSQEAQAIGANAILNIRLSTASVAAGAAEVMAYGTAVIIQPRQAAQPQAGY